jgi:hypothetical protein
MRVRLTSECENLLREFCDNCRSVVPTYDVSSAKVVNLMLIEKLREEIKRFKTKLAK